jgi:hypothetical protein
MMHHDVTLSWFASLCKLLSSISHRRLLSLCRMYHNNCQVITVLLASAVSYITIFLYITIQYVGSVMLLSFVSQWFVIYHCCLCFTILSKPTTYFHHVGSYASYPLVRTYLFWCFEYFNVTLSCFFPEASGLRDLSPPPPTPPVVYSLGCPTVSNFGRLGVHIPCKCWSATVLSSCIGIFVIMWYSCLFLLVVRYVCLCWCSCTEPLHGHH